MRPWSETNARSLGSTLEMTLERRDYDAKGCVFPTGRTQGGAGQGGSPAAGSTRDFHIHSAQKERPQIAGAGLWRCLRWLSHAFHGSGQVEPTPRIWSGPRREWEAIFHPLVRMGIELGVSQT